MSEKLNRTINDLHPLMRVAVNKLERDLLYLDLLATSGKAGFKLFEGYSRRRGRTNSSGPSLR